MQTSPPMFARQMAARAAAALGAAPRNLDAKYQVRLACQTVPNGTSDVVVEIRAVTLQTTAAELPAIRAVPHVVSATPDARRDLRGPPGVPVLGAPRGSPRPRPRVPRCPLRGCGGTEMGAF